MSEDAEVQEIWTEPSEERCLREKKSLVPDCNNLANRKSNYESHSLTTEPQTLNEPQTLAKNKAENRCYEISYNKVKIVIIAKVPLIKWTLLFAS